MAENGQPRGQNKSSLYPPSKNYFLEILGRAYTEVSKFARGWPFPVKHLIYLYHMTLAKKYHMINSPLNQSTVSSLIQSPRTFSSPGASADIPAVSPVSASTTQRLLDALAPSHLLSKRCCVDGSSSGTRTLSLSSTFYSRISPHNSPPPNPLFRLFSKYLLKSIAKPATP